MKTVCSAENIKKIAERRATLFFDSELVQSVSVELLQRPVDQVVSKAVEHVQGHI